MKHLALEITILMAAVLLLSGCTQPTGQASLTSTPTNEEKQEVQTGEEKTAEEQPVEEKTVEEDNSVIPQRLTVSRIIDGDTIELNTGKRVRLICIDTPEQGESGWQEAKDYLTNLILNKSIRLEKDVSETDMYGRLLRYVYLEDLFVNGELVKNGYASVYRFPPDTRLCDDLEELEEEAKAQNLGIWEAEEAPKTNNQTYICSYNAYNCSNFKSQAEAQAVFEACGGISNDIHWLDGDDDGIACERLP